MTASFIGNNRALLGSQQRPLRFVFSSDFIQELTKSLLEVCFRFSSIYFNKFVSHPLQWHSTYPFKVWPKKDVSTRKHLSTTIFCSFDVSSTLLIPSWRQSTENSFILFWDKQLTSLPLPKTGLSVAWYLCFGFKGVKNKSILQLISLLCIHPDFQTWFDTNHVTYRFAVRKGLQK